MMKIRKEQIDAMSADKIDAFVEETVTFLKEEAPEVVEDATDDEIREFIRHGVDRAGHYGIWNAFCMQKYVLFMAWVGEDFDTKRSSRWAAEILNDPTLDQRDKIFELEDYIMSEWEGAK